MRPFRLKGAMEVSVCVCVSVCVLQEAGRLSAWEATAVAYRVERKKLARGAQRVLDIYRGIIDKNT